MVASEILTCNLEWEQNDHAMQISRTVSLELGLFVKSQDETQIKTSGADHIRLSPCGTRLSNKSIA